MGGPGRGLRQLETSNFFYRTKFQSELPVTATDAGKGYKDQGSVSEVRGRGTASGRALERRNVVGKHVREESNVCSLSVGLI